MPDSVLITGGAGFIGVNVAAHYLAQGRRVVIYDNFSRPGTDANRRWLDECWGGKATIIAGDVRERDPRLAAEVERAAVVFHLAAQVAVTTSVTDPQHDFETNALGTFNVLEAVRRSKARPAIIYSSTNKVYGKMADVAVTDLGTRHAYADAPHGIGEGFPLDFYSPYGCSKGTGDQYVIDYARIYGLRTLVFRQSCIYGPHQFGMEDQGWVAWFTIRALQGRPVTVYGDGKQVRDVLWVADLVDAYDAAWRRIETISGRAYNIGGGPAYTLSLLELIDLLDQRFGTPLRHTFEDWRPGDQKVFVSDIRKARADFGWAPKVAPAEGVAELATWLQANEGLVNQVATHA
jgi:CDP-paratose 2-epimerase